MNGDNALDAAFLYANGQLMTQAVIKLNLLFFELFDNGKAPPKSFENALRNANVISRMFQKRVGLGRRLDLGAV